jgi:hypothetical protein
LEEGVRNWGAAVAAAVAVNQAVARKSTPAEQIRLPACHCSFCSILNANGGDRKDKRLASVGAWRPVDENGYTTLHEPGTHPFKCKIMRQAPL